MILCDIEGISYDKIAEVLKCTGQAARLKVFSARVRLKELLEKSLHRKQRH